MSNLPSRRRFLALTGTGTTAALAGCSQLESLTQSDDGTNGDAGGAVTVAVSPPQAELESLNEQLQSGELNRTEALDEQQALNEDAVSAFEDTASDRGISVEDSAAEFGLLQVTGDDSAIMDSLRNGDIRGIYPGDQYDAFVQQEQQRAQQQRMIAEQQQQQQEQQSANETNDSDADSGNESDADNTSASGNESAE
ncbi:hypothetical protein [Halopiger xanaduensis]|uniref:Uncharacterized protein n=1 Tax=Halopiger xanaduensis (strain DSM 18323 / JCM 14033 / SH-6) TaxID=797210 RepID=F8D721_HALXS|nr:hypothetical protein [Halopiger xanaduensis]AEH35452.1 hypothetical protein Halxa_0813 [Halopiger xanaduensis SH-6]